jgi:hypothetical protein
VLRYASHATTITETTTNFFFFFGRGFQRIFLPHLLPCLFTSLLCLQLHIIALLLQLLGLSLLILVLCLTSPLECLEQLAAFPALGAVSAAPRNFKWPLVIQEPAKAAALQVAAPRWLLDYQKR